jgi:galactokinase
MYKTSEIKNQINNGAKDEVFIDLYGKSDMENQKKRYLRLINAFKEKFPESNELMLFSTPGRTELGGNHTDHNFGRVLAASVNKDSIAIASKSDNNIVKLYSEGFSNVFEVNLSELKPLEEEKDSANALIRGVASGFVKNKYKIGGFNCCISSDVLPGSGLSSSASIEVLIGTIFNHLFNNDKMSSVDIAKIGQYAENEFFGKPCGLMDQTACAYGGIISIDFKDNMNPVIVKQEFSFSDSGYTLIVLNTGGNHADLTEDYSSIFNEMKNVALKFNKDACRFITKQELIEKIPVLRKETGERALLRCMHFFNENERVVKQIEALRENRIEDYIKYVNESGNSSWTMLQNCYTNKNPQEQGVTLALALSKEFLGTRGAFRVHGGGFAGTIQAYSPNNLFEHYKTNMEKVFGVSSVAVIRIRNTGTCAV